MKGILIATKFNVEKEKKDGSGSYKVHIVKAEVNGNEKDYSIFANSNLGKQVFSALKGVKSGAILQIETEQNGKFENVTSITNAGGLSSSAEACSVNTSKYEPRKNDDYVKGVIKGNSVTNGVTLAIARFGKDVTQDQILDCAREIMEVHEALDAPEEKGDVFPDEEAF